MLAYGLLDVTSGGQVRGSVSGAFSYFGGRA